MAIEAAQIGDQCPFGALAAAQPQPLRTASELVLTG